MWHVDVLATSSVMYAIRAVNDVTSRQLEVDVGRPLEAVGRRCLPLSEYSKMLMRCQMMSLGADVLLHKVTKFSRQGQPQMFERFWCTRVLGALSFCGLMSPLRGLAIPILHMMSD